MVNLIPVQVTGNIGTIEDNLDAVELSIRERVQEYAAVVVTEDTVKDGKEFLADIRKEKKTLDDERKAIKSRWMAPYEEFEKRAKRIIGLYDEPVKMINGQLAEFEEQRRISIISNGATEPGWQSGRKLKQHMILSRESLPTGSR